MKLFEELVVVLVILDLTMGGAIGRLLTAAFSGITAGGATG